MQDFAAHIGSLARTSAVMLPKITNTQLVKTMSQLPLYNANSVRVELCQRSKNPSYVQSGRLDDAGIEA